MLLFYFGKDTIKLLNMSSINFKGKNIIWNHHLSVPYHTLDLNDQLSFKNNESHGNLIIEGDNLIALKALLPTHAGKIKCIYIDPPYNTGNESWIYNDNVNSPMIREWLGQVVDKDDLTKHDKWLCMMTPRLKLLRELLSDDGIIFISIDDNEVQHLRMLMDELFGEENFIVQFVWQKAAGNQNDNNYVAVSHEYVICYAKDISNCKLYKLPPTEEMLKNYNLEDQHVQTRGKHQLRNLNDFSIGDRPGLHYDIACPDGTVLKGNEHRWRCDINRFKWRISQDRIVFQKNAHNEWEISYKQYINESKEEVIKDAQGNLLSYGKIPDSLLTKVGFTADGKKDLRELFGHDIDFPYPKPVSLIKHLLSIATKNNDIILDSFAGSGTTGQAILELNKKDKGARKFILTQMTENTKEEPNKNVCKDITKVRVQKVIEKEKVEIGFEYKRVGIAIDADSIMNGNLPTYKQFAKYVYYLATGKNLDNESSIDEAKYFVGNHIDTTIHLIYKDDFQLLTKLALNLDFAENINKENGNKRNIVYAPACFLDEEFLDKNNIKFVSIPYNLFERDH